MVGIVSPCRLKPAEKVLVNQCFAISILLFLMPDLRISDSRIRSRIGLNTHTALVLNSGLNQMRVSEKFNIRTLGRVKTRLARTNIHA